MKDSYMKGNKCAVFCENNITSDSESNEVLKRRHIIQIVIQVSDKIVFLLLKINLYIRCLPLMFCTLSS